MGLLRILLGNNTNNQQLKIGDWVEVLTYGEQGQIVEIHGDEYWVEIDNSKKIVDRFKANELKKITSLI